jgi:AcrR family transcriptional regulator
VENDRMPAARRTGTESSKTRAQLLDVTEKVMLEEGYAAVSSRRVAKEADVTPPLVHYYFPSLDNLFIAVFRRRAEEQLARHERLLASDQPLRALWRFNADPAAAGFIAEFMALANHRKSIGAEIAGYVDRFRRAEVEALAAAVRAGTLHVGDVPIPALVMLLTNAAHSIVAEEAIGLTSGHKEARKLIEGLLRDAEPSPAATPTPGRARTAPVKKAAKKTVKKTAKKRATKTANAVRKGPVGRRAGTR